MTPSQWCIFFIITLLLFSKASKNDAFILFVAYLFYIKFIVDLDAIYYYTCSALLNLTVGLALHNINKKAAICSYSLVVVSFYGFALWYNSSPPLLYDTISLLILLIQLLAIIPREILNGFKHDFQYFMARPAVFNRNRACVTMYQSHQKQKTKK